LKNNKAAGLDQIFAELLKHGGHSTVAPLTDLMSNCWRDESVPEEWRKATIVKLPKKGDTSDCNIWRGITLLSVPGKVFYTIMLNRLRDAVVQCCEMNKQYFNVVVHVQSRSLHSAISSSNVWNFGNHCFCLISQKHLTVFTESHYGTLPGYMAPHNNASTSSEVCT